MQDLDLLYLSSSLVQKASLSHGEIVLSATRDTPFATQGQLQIWEGHLHTYLLEWVGHLRDAQSCKRCDPVYAALPPLEADGEVHLGGR